MNIKHLDINIDESNPFLNCKLERKKYATVLTNIIKLYPHGFVLALNNKWGAGKTTFIKMWNQELINDGYKTIYFNAWENDFDNNPLTALMGELKTLCNKSSEPAFKKTLKNLSSLSKHILPTVAKAIADNYIKTDNIKDAIVHITEGISDIFENEVEEYQKKKKGISDFRQHLHDFIQKSTDGKPLIFIIDELDRCRPNYAVSILEQIKHFFSVPNIVFVLSIDKTQLGNAVKGVYGSAEIDADEYLRRFIDIEYTIPEPEKDKFYLYLYDYFEFDNFFNLKVRLSHSKTQDDRFRFLRTCKILFSSQILPLRIQEKIFAHARLALRSFTENNYVVPEFFIFLVFLKLKHNTIYEDMKSKRIEMSDLQKSIFDIFNPFNNPNNLNEFIRIEAYLVTFYFNYTSDGYEKLIIRDTSSNTEKLKYNSYFSSNNDTLLSYIKDLSSGFSNFGDLDISFFTKKIDFVDDIKT